MIYEYLNQHWKKSEKKEVLHQVEMEAILVGKDEE